MHFPVKVLRGSLLNYRLNDSFLLIFSGFVRSLKSNKRIKDSRITVPLMSITEVLQNTVLLRCCLLCWNFLSCRLLNEKIESRYVGLLSLFSRLVAQMLCFVMNLYGNEVLNYPFLEFQPD